MIHVQTTTTRRLPSGCAIPFGLIFAAAGLALIWFLALPTFRETWKVRSWPEVDCTVTKAEVKIDTGGAAPRALPEVAFRFDFGGRTVEGTRLRMAGAVFGKAQAGPAEEDVNELEETCAKLRAAPEQRCRVNPVQPEESILEKPGYGLVMVMLTGGGIFVVLGLGVALAGLGIGRLFGWLATPLFCSLFLVAGVAVYWFGIRGEPDWDEVKARMQDVPCTILSSRVVESTSSGKNRKTTYKAEIWFRYEFGGRTWHSRWPDFGRVKSSSSNGSAARAMVARHPVGQQQTCSVDPTQPWMAVLEKSGGGRAWLWLFPILFGGIGLAGLGWWLLRLGVVVLGLVSVRRG